MHNFLRRGDFYFCVTLALLFTWGEALTLTSFGLREFLWLFCAAVVATVFLSVLLWIATLITKRPIFGTRRIYYFPRGQMLILSAVFAALFAVIYRLSDHSPMTPFHLRTYLIGYLLSVGVLMGYFYLISRKRD